VSTGCLKNQITSKIISKCCEVVKLCRINRSGHTQCASGVHAVNKKLVCFTMLFNMEHWERIAQ